MMRRSAWRPYPAELFMAVLLAPVTIGAIAITLIVERPGFAPVLAAVCIAITIKLVAESAYIAGMRAEADSHLYRGDANPEA